MRRTALLVAILAIVAIPAAAQGGRHGMKWLDEPTLEAALELGRTLTTWARSEVLPEAQTWKSRLDNAISPDDLAKLNELRRRAAALRERRTAITATMREAWRGENDDALKSARAELKTLGQEREEILRQLKPIAERNRATLEAIGEAAKPKLKEWTEEARTIGQQWYEANKGRISPMAAQAVGRLLTHRRDLFQLVEPKLRTKAAVARFMLWSGDDFTREIDGMLERGSIESGAQELDLE